MALARFQRTIVDDQGNVQASASVEVRLESDNSLVSLFSDRDGLVAIGNPFLADSEGFAAFHVIGGAYKITATKGGFSRIWRYVGIGTASEFDADAITVDIAAQINSATSKTTPVNADELALVDSAASNVLKKLTWANLKATLKTYFDTLYVGSSAVREKLTAARTYYVRTDGSDSNTGLVDSAGGAFLTIQKAIDVASSLDLSIYDVTIDVGNGTYTTASGNQLKSFVGSGSIIILGDETTPANVIITTNGTGTVNDGVFYAYAVKGTYKLRGMQLKSTAASLPFGILVAAASYVEFQTLDFNSGLFQQLRIVDGGVVKATGNYTVSASTTNAHLNVSGNAVARIQSITITITGTPAWGTGGFAVAGLGAAAIMTSITFSGSATGPRYNIASNAAIQTGGVATYFPGDTAGSVTTGGQYF